MIRFVNLRSIAVLIGLFLFAHCASAQTPSTQPDGARVRYNALSKSEQKQVDDWVAAKMPNLARLINNAPETGSRPYRHLRLQNAAAARWRGYQQAKESSSLEPAMKSIRLEDEIFGYIGQLDDATPDKRQLLKDQIRDKTKALVDLFLADRADRIAKLQAKLDAENRNLETDRQRANMLVDQRLAHFMVDLPTTKPSDDADVTTAPSP